MEISITRMLQFSQQLFAGLNAKQRLHLRTILEVVLHNGEQLEEVPL